MAGKSILYVIDLDRTLLDVHEAMRLTGKICADLGVDYSHIKIAQAEAAEEKRPYSPLHTVAGFGDELLDEFRRRFYAEAEADRFIYPDAKKFLAKLDEDKRAYMILTYAVDERWQKVKMKAAGVDHIPHLIVGAAHKSKEIQSWQGKHGKFQPPVKGVNPAESLVFIDDRLRVFVDMPDNCQGFYLKRPDGVPEDGELPDNVIRINSFDEIIDQV